MTWLSLRQRMVHVDLVANQGLQQADPLPFNLIGFAARVNRLRACVEPGDSQRSRIRASVAAASRPAFAQFSAGLAGSMKASGNFIGLNSGSVLVESRLSRAHGDWKSNSDITSAPSPRTFASSLLAVER